MINHRLTKTNHQFFLVTENTFHSSYLVNEWSRRFRYHGQYGGILIRGTQKTQGDLQKRTEAHRFCQTMSIVPSTQIEILDEAYGGLSDSERLMVMLYGVPSESCSSVANVCILDRNLNSDIAIQQMEELLGQDQEIILFIFLDQILGFWWLQRTKYIVNAHSAVLPYARGMYALENIACLGDAQQFLKVAGATVHYVDSGVDTGSIIHSMRIRDPFQYETLWEVKARCYQLAFKLLVGAAEVTLDNLFAEHVGVIPEHSLVGQAFRARDFTHELKINAASTFSSMRKAFYASDVKMKN
ncbi:MAG: formyltransferase family protein [Bacilli bacterium]